MTFILTRSEPGATQSQIVLQKRGYESFKAPVLTQKPLPLSSDFLDRMRQRLHLTHISVPEQKRVVKPFQNIKISQIPEEVQMAKSGQEGNSILNPLILQAVIFTSANAIRLLPEALLTLCCLPAYVVGDKTALAAKNRGFTTILNAHGCAEDLLSLLLQTACPQAGSLIHFSGDPIARDLLSPLRKAGFTAERYSVYRASPRKTLPKEIHERFLYHPEDLYLFYSPLAGQVFKQLLAGQLKISDWQTAFSSLEKRKMPQALTISPTVSQTLPPVFRKVLTAQKPSEESMFSLLDRF